MVMFMPSQSHSGGVSVNPYIGNIAQELQFLTKGKKTQHSLFTAATALGFFSNTRNKQVTVYQGVVIIGKHG